ncbi:MAG: aspartate aminotransferase family protein [Kordiimonadaceae bacterium]|jgi:acetylornithine/N-succinyldiaminopimelate aminotransferase|nr:aspartate aminotransferase family protein [Kordiimonadaceae bacterium]MBT6036078.1 aspartate aminotransferase family protein [Kordiimonadaceae bacterium]MBT6330774.1 aspartate aminotransferase family protein [Kordiimonadaceae bacterium]
MTEKQNNISPILPTYARMNVTFEYGTGSRLYDTDGNEYLDFGSGIAVNCLGHCHPALVKAVKDQAEKLWHTSNIYHIAGQEKLANRLRELTFADSMFFTNSGAEAVECAIKMARRYHDANEQPERYRVITFEGSFHGRTLATIAAGGSEKLTKGFGPKVDGFDVIRFHRDMRNVEEAITHETAAIMIEPIQGEGGIRQVSDDNLQILRDIADEHGILLIYDEIQCGMGRTGKLFYHQYSGVTPDIMSVAKGIGGGYPLGACLATENVAKHMTTGTHGSTYGGNPMAMAMGNAVLDVFEAENTLGNVQKMSDKLKLDLMKLRKKYPEIIEMVRGYGLMIGLKLHVEPRDFVIAAFENKMLIVAAAENTVRILPPLNITEGDIHEAIKLLDKTCSDMLKINDTL